MPPPPRSNTKTVIKRIRVVFISSHNVRVDAPGLVSLKSKKDVVAGRISRLFRLLGFGEF
jgi:hypothetical protein